MDLRHVIHFEMPIDDELHELLVNSGSRPHTQPTDWLTPSVESFESLKTKLTEKRVPFEVFFDIQPSPGDDLEDLAAYLTLDDFSSLDVDSGDLVLACDERTLATVASEKMINFLAGVTEGTTWDPLSGHDGFFVLTDLPELSEPVVVPRAMFLSEATTGTWAVQSDGRELLTADNLRRIRDQGIAETRACVVDGQVIPWSRPPIFSGKVLR
ncbi:MAG: hypothetical protein ACREUM_04495, partial [Nitrosospira sp.]